MCSACSTYGEGLGEHVHGCPICKQDYPCDDPNCESHYILTCEQCEEKEAA